MSLMRPFSNLREDMNRLFNEIDREFLTPWTARGGMMGRGGESQSSDMMALWAPAVDIIEEDQDIKVKAQIPGIRPEDLDIEVDNHTLCICGETQEERQEEQGGNVYRKEIAYGKFFRRVPLPTDVKAEEAQANFENGLLTITLPKAEQTKRHKVKVGGQQKSSSSQQ